MATAKFTIRRNRANAEGLCTIYIIYTHQERSTLISTGEKINPEHWDDTKGVVKRSYGRGSVTFNDTLKTKIEEVEAIKRLTIQQGIEPTIEQIKTQWEARSKPKVPEVNRDFFILFEKFIQDTASSKVHGTNKHYKSTLTHLRNFAAKKRLKFTLDTFDVTVYDKLVSYLVADLNQTAGTVNNQIKRVRVFFNYLYERGIHQDLTFKKFKLLKQAETDVIYLTAAELEQVYRHNFSQNPRLERVRDLLVFSCTTGLRQSDFSKIKPEHVKGNILSLRTRKTKDPLRIPLTSYSAVIIEKYNRALPTLSQQKYNDYVKEVCQLAGIDEPTEHTHYIGSKRITQTVSKHELISSHTGRRTFITLSLERGMRPETVMKITGHKDLKTMMRYVKVTDKMKEVEMNAVWGQVLTEVQIG